MQLVGGLLHFELLPVLASITSLQRLSLRAYEHKVMQWTEHTPRKAELKDLMKCLHVRFLDLSYNPLDVTAVSSSPGKWHCLWHCLCCEPG